MFAAILFALTLVMIALHVGEWLLLAHLARAARTPPVKSTRFPRILRLMNFLRFEAFYYGVLVAFWLTNPGAVPGAAVLLLGAIHVGGWLVLEARKSAPEIEVLAATAAQNPEAKLGGARVSRVLGSIAAFDAVEVAVLGYLAYRLWP